MAPQIVKKPVTPKGKTAKKKSSVKNKDLGSGVMLYSRSKIYKRKAIYLLKKAKRVNAEKKPKVAITVVKKINGAKNGGDRVVLLKKPKANYPTKDKTPKRPAKSYFSKHTRNTKKSIRAGRVVILLAGHHAGKRVVVLKVLKTGLLLVNGPFALNGCPLRRVNQRFVLATQTRLNLGKYRVPAHIDDRYFKRQNAKKKSRGEGDIFAAKKEKYAPSEQRITDQVEADKVIKGVINAHPDKIVLTRYLKSMFGLKSSQYPHRMKF